MLHVHLHKTCLCVWSLRTGIPTVRTVLASYLLGRDGQRPIAP